MNIVNYSVPRAQSNSHTKDFIILLEDNVTNSKLTKFLNNSLNKNLKPDLTWQIFFSLKTTNNRECIGLWV